MKRNFMLSLAILITLSSALTGTIHDYTVSKIEGGSQSLSIYAGKKILVITLPIVRTAAADSLLYSLDTLAAARTSSLKVIAVPSYEDGYTAANKEQLQQWYQDKLGTYISVTEGIYTRKTSGEQQHPLFKWLTSEEGNEIYAIDVEGPGHKFFAGASGQLFSVLRPHTRIGSTAVQKTLELD